MIPQVVENLTRDEDRARPTIFPDHCPECGSEAVAEEGEVDVRCTGGLVCHAQQFERLRHFVSRAALDIEGLGEKSIAEFMELGWLAKGPADIFRLHKHRGDLVGREGWQDKSVDNLLARIEAKRRPMPRGCCSGSASAMSGRSPRATCSRRSPRCRRLRETARRRARGRCRGAASELTMIEGVGPVVVEALGGLLPRARTISTVWDDLLGEVAPPPFIVETTASAVSGKTVVFTGHASKPMPRDEAKAQAERLGARAAGSVSPKTDCVVAGPGAGRQAEEGRGARDRGDRTRRHGSRSWPTCRRLGAERLPRSPISALSNWRPGNWPLASAAISRPGLVDARRPRRGVRLEIEQVIGEAVAVLVELHLRDGFQRGPRSPFLRQREERHGEARPSVGGGDQFLGIGARLISRSGC